MLVCLLSDEVSATGRMSPQVEAFRLQVPRTSGEASENCIHKQRDMSTTVRGGRIEKSVISHETL